MRWIGNGNKHIIGQFLALSILLISLTIVFCCCATQEGVINIKKSLPSGVDYFVVKANYDSKKDKDFMIEMEEWASRQKWERYVIDPYYAVRIGSKHIRGVIIYYWEIK